MAHDHGCGCDLCQAVAREAVPVMPADLALYADLWSRWISTDDGEARKMRAGGEEVLGNPGSPRWVALQAIARSRIAATAAAIAAEPAAEAPAAALAAGIRWEVSGLAPTVLVERVSETEVRNLAIFPIAHDAPLASPAGRDAIAACQMAAATPRLVDALASLLRALRTPRLMPGGTVHHDLRQPMIEATEALAVAMDGAALLKEVGRG